MATKKKSNIGKKIANFFKKVGKAIADLFMKGVNKFRSLPKYIRIIVYIWTAIVLILIILVIGVDNNKKKLAEYQKMEEAVRTAAIAYSESHDFYSTVTKKLKVNVEVLQEEKLLSKDDIDRSCHGFALVYYNDSTDEYIADSYINCNKYTTKGYGEYRNYNN